MWEDGIFHQLFSWNVCDVGGRGVQGSFPLLPAAWGLCCLLKPFSYPCTCTCPLVSVKARMYNLVNYPNAAVFRICPMSKNIPRVFVFVYCAQFEQNSAFRPFLVQATALLSLQPIPIKDMVYQA